MELVIKDVYTSVRHSGLTCKLLTLVKKIKDLECNKINQGGCSHLSRVHWPKLITINLGRIFSIFRE